MAVIICFFFLNDVIKVQDLTKVSETKCVEQIEARAHRNYFTYSVLII